MFLKTCFDMVAEALGREPAPDAKLLQAVSTLNKAMKDAVARFEETSHPMNTETDKNSPAVQNSSSRTYYDLMYNLHEILWQELQRRDSIFAGEYPPEQGSPGQKIFSKLLDLMSYSDGPFNFRLILNQDRKASSGDDKAVLHIRKALNILYSTAYEFEALQGADIQSRLDYTVSPYSVIKSPNTKPELPKP